MTCTYRDFLRKYLNISADLPKDEDGDEWKQIQNLYKSLLHVRQTNSQFYEDNRKLLNEGWEKEDNETDHKLL